MVSPKRLIRSSVYVHRRARESRKPPASAAPSSPASGRRGRGDEGVTAAFKYDGDGNRVQGTVGGVTTIYIGSYFEWTGSGSTQYYGVYPERQRRGSSQRIAMRRSGYSQDNGLFWLFGDHLGSTSVTANSGGGYFSEVRYKAWGETRFTNGNTPTTFRFTGQRQEADLGLYFYNARWYDPALGRFIQADTIVPQPGNSQAWDRYAYTLNNPVKYIDPDGHKPHCPDFGGCPIYIPDDAVIQAWELVWDWLFETGEKTRYFGPEEPLTQEVMNDSGVDQFKKEWAKSGYEVPFFWEHNADEREEGSIYYRVAKGSWIYFREHFIELGLSTLGFGSKDPKGPIDPVGGTIGSLDQIYVEYTDNGVLIYLVHNTMGWKSASRIPGTNHSIIQDRDRKKWGPGGTIEQYFFWYEPKSINIFDDNR